MLLEKGGVPGIVPSQVSEQFGINSIGQRRRLRYQFAKVEETPEEYMMSAVFGIEVTQNQIDAAPPPRGRDVKVYGNQ